MGWYGMVGNLALWQIFFFFVLLFAVARAALSLSPYPTDKRVEDHATSLV